MAQYLLSVWHDEDFEMPDEITPELQELFETVGKFNEEIDRAGVFVFGGGLMPASTATVVRSDGVDVSMTDGPFAESKEIMGGFWVIDAPDLDAALEWARKGAAACQGPVEVRPFQSEPDA